MKNIIILILSITILFSCQHRTEIKKKSSKITKDTILNKEIKVDTITRRKFDSVETEDDEEEIKEYESEVKVMLPKNRYAVITLQYYIDREEDFNGNIWLCKPKEVKVFNRTTNKQLPETRLDDFYADKHEKGDNDSFYYGDFNFDGKMDVACRGESSYYRDFYTWNFYLATSNGYEFSKSFSKIMDDAIAYLEIDAKNKRILAYREAEYYNCSEYKIKNNKAELIKQTITSHDPSPFISHYEIIWKGKKWTQTKNYLTLSNDKEEQEKQTLLSFDLKNKRKKIMFFVDDTMSPRLCYVEIKNDSIVDFTACDIAVNYNVKENTVFFLYENKRFKISEGTNRIDIEITENGKTIKSVGIHKSKKGSLSNFKSKGDK